jgi:hypothetical protein
MLSSYKDENGKIIGFIEWWQTGQSGIQKFRGEYVWINEMWIHEDYRDGKAIMNTLIRDVLRKAPDAKFGYFQRKKYNDRVSRLHTREEFEHLLEKGVLNVVLK